MLEVLTWKEGLINIFQLLHFKYLAFNVGSLEIKISNRFNTCIIDLDVGFTEHWLDIKNNQEEVYLSVFAYSFIFGSSSSNLPKMLKPIIKKTREFMVGNKQCFPATIICKEERITKTD